MAPVRSKHKSRGFIREHSLGLTVLALLLVWLLLYMASDPSTHLGAFYGNAVADWLGTLIIVVATKYLYEIGSAESRQPHPGSRSAFMRMVIDHSLTIGLCLTGILWAIFYSRLDVNGKTGQVVGNIVSEWTQI